jgi:hypothetical protein
LIFVHVRTQEPRSARIRVHQKRVTRGQGRRKKLIVYLSVHFACRSLFDGHRFPRHIVVFRSYKLGDNSTEPIKPKSPFCSKMRLDNFISIGTRQCRAGMRSSRRILGTCGEGKSPDRQQIYENTSTHRASPSAPILAPTSSMGCLISSRPFRRTRNGAASS